MESIDDNRIYYELEGTPLVVFGCSLCRVDSREGAAQVVCDPSGTLYCDSSTGAEDVRLPLPTREMHWTFTGRHISNTTSCPSFACRRRLYERPDKDFRKAASLIKGRSTNTPIT